MTVKLGTRTKPGQVIAEKPEVLDELGFSVEALSEELARGLGYEGMSGVVISDVEPGSLASMAGIRAGILIMEVNGEQVPDTKEFNKAVKKAAKKGVVRLLTNNGRFNQFIAIILPEK